MTRTSSRTAGPSPTEREQMRRDLGDDRTHTAPKPMTAAELTEFHLWLYNETAHRGQVELWRDIMKKKADDARRAQDER